MREFDYSKLNNRTWDNEILGLVAQIHEYKGRQELYLKQKPYELVKLSGITSNAMAKMGRNESVQVDTLGKVCAALNCNVDDIKKDPRRGQF